MIVISSWTINGGFHNSGNIPKIQNVDIFPNFTTYCTILELFPTILLFLILTFLLRHPIQYKLNKYKSTFSEVHIILI